MDRGRGRAGSGGRGSNRNANKVSSSEPKLRRNSAGPSAGGGNSRYSPAGGGPPPPPPRSRFISGEGNRDYNRRRPPGGGGSSGSRVAFDKGHNFGSGPGAICFEREKQLWKVGPAEGGRFQLKAFLHQLSGFIEYQRRQAAHAQRHTIQQIYSRETKEGGQTVISISSSLLASGLHEPATGDDLSNDDDDEEDGETVSSKAPLHCRLPAVSATEGNKYQDEEADADDDACEFALSSCRHWWPLINADQSGLALPRNAVAQESSHDKMVRSGPPLHISLRLERLDLTDKEAGMLSDWIVHESRSGSVIVRKLWLFGNRLGDEGAAAVARIFSKCAPLMECHLSHNMITLVGAQTLLESIPVGGPTRDMVQPLWLRLEWNRISLEGLVHVLESQHAQRGLVADLPEAVRADAAPPLPRLPHYIIIAATNASDDQKLGEESGKGLQKHLWHHRSARNALRFLLDASHVRLPWISSQFELPAESAVLKTVKSQWSAEHVRKNRENQKSKETSFLIAGRRTPDAAATSTGPLLLLPDTSAMLSMLNAPPSVTLPTFLSLDWLSSLSQQGLFGRSLPPSEQTFIVVPASVATQLDALKADPRAKSAIRRFMAHGLDELGPSGANWLTMLAHHEAEGHVLEREAEVTGSRDAYVATRGQAVDHRIVEVGLFFQGQCMQAMSTHFREVEASSSPNDRSMTSHTSENSSITHPMIVHSLPVILLTSDNGQAQIAKSHGLPTVRMAELAALEPQITGCPGKGRALTATILREALRPVATMGLGTVASRSLQAEFDSAVACLHSAVEALEIGCAKTAEVSDVLGNEVIDDQEKIVLARGVFSRGEQEGFFSNPKYLSALRKRLVELDALVRSHQSTNRILAWSGAGEGKGMGSSSERSHYDGQKEDSASGF